MVISTCVYRKRILLYRGGRALLMQMADWIAQHPDFALLRVPSCRDVPFERLMDANTPVIADATDEPEQVMKFIARTDADLARSCLCVYSESAQHHLERAVREVGLPYVSGTLTCAEWSKILQWRLGPDNGNSAGVEGSVLFVWRAQEFIPI